MLGHNCLRCELGKPIGNIISLVLLLSTSSVMYVSSTGAAKGQHHHVVLKEGHKGHIISCTTQLEVSIAMYFQSVESKTSKEMYDRYELINGYKKMFNMTYNSTLLRNFTLSTNKVEKKHAGEYTCYDNEGIGALLSTTVLTVVDSKPYCEKIREEESSSLVLSCRFSFLGTLPNLDFQWTNKDADGPTNLPGGDFKISNNSLVCTIAVRDDDSSLNKHFTFIVRRKECEHSSCFIFQTPVVLAGDRFSSFQTTEVKAKDSLNSKWIVVIVFATVLFILVNATCIAILVILHRKRKNMEAAHSSKSEIKKPNYENPTQLTSIRSFNDPQSTVTSIRSFNDPQSTVTSIRSVSDPQSTFSSGSPLIKSNANMFGKE